MTNKKIMKHFKSQQTNSQIEDFFNKLKCLPENKIEEFISKARELGITESQINQGLKIIKQIKSSH